MVEHYKRMKGNRIVGIYPYWRDPLSKFGEYPPLGLELIASCIEDLVEEITILDMRFERDISSYLRRAEMILVSLNWGHLRAIGAARKKYELERVLEFIRNFPQDKFTIVGGRFATDSPEFIFQSCPNVDVVIRGYGERTIRELFLKENPEEVRGISYRRGAEIINTPDNDPNFITSVYPNRQRRRYEYQIGSLKVDSIFASRGCPYQCIFCEFPVKKWYARSAESILEEIKSIDRDVEVIYFADDNFLMRAERAKRLCELIIQEKIRKKFVIECRVDSLARHPELIKEMGEAGFLFSVGVENGNDHILNWLQKGYNVATIRRAFDNLRGSGILSLGFFIVGNVGESKDEMLGVGKFARQLGLDHIAVSRLRCYPNTLLEEELKKHPDYHINRRAIVYSDKCSVAELTQILKRIYRDFYTPYQILRTLCRTSLHFNLPKFLRHLLLRIMFLSLLKRKRLWYNIAPLIRRYNIFSPLDYLLNSILRLLARNFFMK